MLSYPLRIRIPLVTVDTIEYDRTPSNGSREETALIETFVCGAQLETISELLFFIFVGIEKGLNLAADALYNEKGGARMNATKFMIVFTDGDFTPFSPVSIVNTLE